MNKKFILCFCAFLASCSLMKFNLNPIPTFTPFPPTETMLPPTTTPLPPTTTPLPPTFNMVLVPEGSFSMGSETHEDESPIHLVELSAYYIDQYEVTNVAYKRCVDASICAPPKQSNAVLYSAYYGNPEFDDYPVVNVDWNMAKTYCEWRDARLPTEAEWEKAANGREGYIYPWGTDISCNRTNYFDGYKYCVGSTTKVGTYESGKSPYSVYDMAGNVSEWVNDWYDPIYYQSSPSLNPLGPDSGERRVLRGGSFNNREHFLRIVGRNAYNPTDSYSDLGFRCARGS
jgi:eukaryotic-like serine/threonine-protein kinase